MWSVLNRSNFSSALSKLNSLITCRYTNINVDSIHWDGWYLASFHSVFQSRKSDRMLQAPLLILISTVISQLFLGQMKLLRWLYLRLNIKLIMIDKWIDNQIYVFVINTGSKYLWVDTFATIFDGTSFVSLDHFI